MKVAVSSSDGRVVNQHFGKTTQFLVYEVTPDHHILVDVRPNEPPCGLQFLADDPGEHRMEQSINLIGDCQVILCSRIGTGAAESLRDRGIKPFEAPLTIDLALEKLSRALAQKLI